MTTTKHLAIPAALAALAAGAASAETWDMPLAYPATNFHTETAQGFADCVREATGGEIDIQTHPNGSLFSGGDIKRAVQTGQAPIGERLLSAHANEDELFGYDSVPFLATSFDESVALAEAAEPTLTELLESQNLVHLYSVPWPPQGLYAPKEIGSVEDLEGPEVPRLQRRDRPARGARRDAARPDRGGRAEPGAGHGRRRELRVLGLHGLRREGVGAPVALLRGRRLAAAQHDLRQRRRLGGADRRSSSTAMRDCAAQAQEEGLAKSKELTQFYLDGLAEGGMTVEPPSDELRADLQAIGETMTAEWLEATGEEGRSIIDAYGAGG